MFIEVGEPEHANASVADLASGRYRIERDLLRSENDDYKSRIQKLISSLSDKDAANQQLKEDLQRTKKLLELKTQDCDRIGAESRHAERQMKSVRLEVELLANTLQKSKALSQATRAEIDKLIADNEDKSRQVKSLQKANKELETKLQGALDNAKNVEELLVLERATSQTRLSQLQTFGRKLENETEMKQRLEKRVLDLSQQLKECLSEIGRLNASKDAVERQASSASSVVQSCENALADMRKSLKRIINDKDARIEALEASLAGLSRSIDITPIVDDKANINRCSDAGVQTVVADPYGGNATLSKGTTSSDPATLRQEEAGDSGDMSSTCAFESRVADVAVDSCSAASIDIQTLPRVTIDVGTLAVPCASPLPCHEVAVTTPKKRPRELSLPGLVVKSPGHIFVSAGPTGTSYQHVKPTEQIDDEQLPNHSFGCPHCGESGYGLMVACGGCGREYHSGCVRKLSARIEGDAAFSKGSFKLIQKEQFRCQMCR